MTVLRERPRMFVKSSKNSTHKGRALYLFGMDFQKNARAKASKQKLIIPDHRADLAVLNVVACRIDSDDVEMNHVG